MTTSFALMPCLAGTGNEPVIMQSKKSQLLWIALLCMSACAGAPGAASHMVTSPRELMQQLLLASKSRDYAAVRSLVYAFRPYEGMNAPGADVMAWEIVAARMKTTSLDDKGDWSYSDEAMVILLGDKDLEFRIAPRGPSKRAQDMIPAADMFYAELRGCSIWVARVEGSWKLVFWEGMNNLCYDQR